MKKYWILILSLIIGSFLRLYQLGSLPGALTWDEAALGYNAYSILKTGRDEYGKFLPLTFKSFGDYKPGAYVYLAIPSVAILGLTEFAVRLPSAIFGILAILGVYLLVIELFPKEKKKNLLASFSALSLAVMPLHIHFSRGAWETNVFTTLLLFAIYFLVKFIKTGKHLNTSLILSLVTLTTYQAAKMMTPLAFLLVILIFWKDFFINFQTYLQNRKNTAIFVFSGIAIIILFASSVFGTSGNRLKRLSIFGYRPEVTEETWHIDNQNKTSVFFFHNSNQLTVRLVAGRYLKHLSTRALFYEGIAPVMRGHVPGMGEMLPFDFIWLALGLIFLVRFTSPKISALIIGLLIISPLPGSLTLSEYSTIRTLFMAVPLSIICGLGMYYGFSKAKPLFIVSFIATALVFFYFVDILFVHAKFTYNREFQFGYKEAMQFINQYPESRVVMTDVWGQPYIFYLFYSRFDPATYQKINSFECGGFDVGQVSHLGDKVEFHQFGKSEISTQLNTIFVGTVGNIDEQFDFSLPTIEKHEDVLYPNGEIMLRIIKTKNVEKE
jgi:4-amino-4-deoxy-L-arabinose transferase-like glycosyltransferase